MRRTLWRCGPRPAVISQGPATASPPTSEVDRDRWARPASPTTASRGSTRAWAAVLGHLAEHGPASAKELRAALPHSRAATTTRPESVGAAGPTGAAGIDGASVRGDIVRGPNDGTWTMSRPRWAPTARLAAAGSQPVEPENGACRTGRRWLRNVRTGHGRRHQVVVRQHADVGAGSTARRRRRRGRPRRHARLRAARRSRARARVEPLVRAAARPRRGDDGLAGPGLVPRASTAAHVFDRNGNGGPTAWCDGRIVGGWTQDADGRVVLQLVEEARHRDRRRPWTARPRS